VPVANEDVQRARLEIERQRLELDTAKWTRETELGEREQSRSRWSNPLTIAILTATAAAVGNIILSFSNGLMQRDLEQRKSESALILEMLKTSDADSAAANLQFLVDSGLLTDPQQVRRLRAYLRDRKPGQGVALPSPTSAPRPPDWEPLKTSLRVADTAAHPFQLLNPPMTAPMWQYSLSGSYTVANGVIRGRLDGGTFTVGKLPTSVTITRIRFTPCYRKKGTGQGRWDVLPGKGNEHDSKDVNITLEDHHSYKLPQMDFWFPAPKDADPTINSLCAEIFNSVGGEWMAQ
jgi:hypothetical protein